MVDSGGRYTEVTSRSWFSRIGGSLKGILFGVILIFAAAWLLFWNEGRTVRRARALDEGAGVVVSVPAAALDPAREAALVHVTGTVATDELLRDETFGIEENAIHLRRHVEMYQWREQSDSDTDTNLGGGTETTTTYTYEKTWSPSLIRSASFEQPEGHQNPGSMPYESRAVSASEVMLGAFKLSPPLISSIRGEEPLRIESVYDLPPDLAWRAKLDGGGVYVGRDPATPEVGDVRVRFEVVRPAAVSVVAQQVGDRLVPYETASGNVLLLDMGIVDAAQMFAGAQSANNVMKWVLRLLGYFLMVFSVRLLLAPFSVLADVLPPVGAAVQAVSGFLSYFIALAMTAGTIAVAWLYYRPLIGITLLVVAIGAVVMAVIGVRKAMSESREPTV
jgi:hypothetical protein